MSKVIEIDGERFELVPNYPSGALKTDMYPGQELYSLRPFYPTPQEPEWEVNAVFVGNDYWSIRTALRNSSDPQAEAIKEAISSLMEYVYGKGYTEKWVMMNADKAQTLIRGKQ